MVEYDVTIYYFDSPHLYQIYDGFHKLKRQGICKLKWIPEKASSKTKPVLKTIINGKLVYFDCLDGYNWINASVEENIDYYKKQYIKSERYFKRSYASEYGIGLPLGLSYNVAPEYYPSISLRCSMEFHRLMHVVFDNVEGPMRCEEIAFRPIVKRNGKILFLARLWNPEDVKSDDRKKERQKINENRMEAVYELRKEFGDMFIGGFCREEYSLEHCPHEFLMQKDVTNRNAYIRTMHDCNICIATDGLHKSIGWKFGEYVASSKAIVTEKLNYEVPGDFSEGKNYLSFSDSRMMITQVKRLVNDEKATLEMMTNNYNYYNQYLRPDRLVLNALKQI